MSTQKKTQRTRTQQANKEDDWGVKKIADIKRGRSFVFYGGSGTGKTTLAATFPGPILLLDVRDEGTDSIADVEDIDVREIESFEELEEIYWLLKDNPKKYKTVIIDTVSQLQQMVVEEQAGGKKKSKDARPGDWGSMTKKDWGEVAGLLKEWLINFRDLSKLKMNIVFIAQHRAFNFGEEEDSLSELRPEIGPALSPSVASTLNAAVSLIGNTFIRSRTIKKKIKGLVKKEEVTEYCLRIGPNPVYITKVRKPRDIEAPSVIADPTYEKIVSLIKGED